MKRAKQLLLVLSIFVLVATAATITVHADGGSGGGSGSSDGSGGSDQSGSGDPSSFGSSGSSSSGSTSSGGSGGSGSSSSGDTGGSSNSSTTSSGSRHGVSSGLRSSGDNSSNDSKDGSENETKVEDNFHTEGQTLLAQAEKDHKSGKSESELQKVCNARKNGIETRTTSLVKAAQASLTRINTVLSEATTFQKDNSLTVANFDTLVATATAAQTTATTSVQALAAVNPTLDCTSSLSAASQLATFKAAITQTRTDLIAYRGAVQDVLTAIENTKSTEGQ